MANGGYAMVPGWLLDLQPDGNDVLIYCTLAKYGTFNTVTGIYNECRPAIETMAKDTGKHPSTIRRALKNLAAMKAIKGTPQFNADGSQAPTVYRVFFGTLIGPNQGPDQGLSPETDPPTTGGSPSHGWKGVVPPVEGGGITREQEPRTLNPEPKTQNKNTSSPVADAPVGGEPKGKKAPKEPEPVDPEVERLCQLLADLIAADGTKRPTVTKAWRDECRRLMEIDLATVKQVEYVIRWSQGHPFWSTNILSMPKLRQQYAALVKRIKAENVKPVSGGAPAKSFKQQDEDAKAATLDLLKQARAAWLAANPGGNVNSPAAYGEIAMAVKQLEKAAKDQLASCSATPYSGYIEGESYETTPLAIGGAQS